MEAANGHKKPRKERRLIENADCSFARALGSTDFHTREAGLQALTSWLAKRHDIEELELLKLWKGVFYAFWHSDKQPVQAALAERLSEIMTQMPEEVGWLYYATFVRTMRREWFGIDRLRLDKFMMLIRKFFAAALRQLQEHSWQPRRVQRLADFWLSEILVPQDTLAAVGVAFHLADLLLPELAGCLQQGGGGAAAPDDATLRALLEPFCRALAAAASPALIHRLRQGVFDPLVEEVRQLGEAAPLRNLDVAALAAHLFDLGAQAETRARNREALYAVSAALEKAAAQQQRRQEQQEEGGKKQREGKGPKSAQKKSAKMQQQEEQRQAAAAEAEAAAQRQHHAADGQQQQAQEQPPPSSSKKGKKRRQAEEAAAAAAAEAAAVAAAAPSAPPPSSSKKKKKHLQEQQQAQHEVPAREQELLAAAVAAVTGGAGAHTPGAGAGGSPSKKSVRFSLKRNLVNVIGQPPKPEDVRTPPTAKPKGSALKKEGLIGGPASAPERLLTRAGMGRLAQFQSYMNGRAEAAVGPAPGSASRAEGGSSKKQKRRASLPAPGSFSRPRASEFF